MRRWSTKQRPICSAWICTSGSTSAAWPRWPPPRAYGCHKTRGGSAGLKQLHPQKFFRVPPQLSQYRLQSLSAAMQGFVEVRVYQKPVRIKRVYLVVEMVDHTLDAVVLLVVFQELTGWALTRAQVFERAVEIAERFAQLVVLNGLFQKLCARALSRPNLRQTVIQ